MAAPTRLIIVCCHGIWLGGPTSGRDEAEWLIADFQRGETPTFAAHAREGVRLLAEGGGDAVLVFSGGPTRTETVLSEAASYANLAGANDYWGLIANPASTSTPAASAAAAASHQSILIEDRALDSYHNILFSLTRFRTHFGHWPSILAIVSHGFKRGRIVDGHCAAVGFPLKRVLFVGIDPPGMAVADGGNAAAMKGVGQAADDWTADPHGRGQALAGKRRRRNPQGVWQGVFSGEVSDKGGLVTRGEGEGETLDEEARRPW